jgi:hypothetical protein
LFPAHAPSFLYQNRGYQKSISSSSDGQLVIKTHTQRERECFCFFLLSVSEWNFSCAAYPSAKTIDRVLGTFCARAFANKTPSSPFFRNGRKLISPHRRGKKEPRDQSYQTHARLKKREKYPVQCRKGSARGKLSGSTGEIKEEIRFHFVNTRLCLQKANVKLQGAPQRKWPAGVGVGRITAAAAKELLTSSRRDPVSRVCAVILHANAAEPIF